MTHATQITIASPFSARFAAYLAERFPLVILPFCVALYASGALLARALEGAGPLALGWRDALAGVGLYALLLANRCLDEHKDYDHDTRHFPGRLLQRGVITLDHLKVVAAITLAYQLGVSLLIDGGVGVATIAWVVFLVMNVARLYDFGLVRWLPTRPVLQVSAHLFLMVFIGGWIAALGTTPAVPSLSTLLLVAAIYYPCGYALELARKLRAPTEEKDGVHTATSLHGLRRAPLLMLAAHVVAVGIMGVALHLAGVALLPRLVGYALLAGTFLTMPVRTGLAFRRTPTPALGKAADFATGGALMTYHYIVAAVLLWDRGLAW